MKWMDDFRRLLHRLRRESPEASLPGGLSCQHAIERVFEWLDGELGPDQSERVSEHLQTCARCYPQLVFESSFREAMARVPNDEAMPEDLEDRILEGLRAQGFAAP